MHLSRLYISGFRSIRELDLRFLPGKNVIIGRNNAGKSNVMRALDVVLGETAPAYARSENITESDFHTSKWVDGNGELHEFHSNEIRIWCELERAHGEALNWTEIDKCFGFSYWGDRNSKAANRVSIEFLTDDFPKAFQLSEDEAGYAKVWVDAKLNNQSKFREVLDPMFHFAYSFQAKLTEKGVEKQLRFLFREGEGEQWMLAFRAPVRTEILQSAILPAFRDPATQLRVSPWTWFGKLMRHLTKDCRDDDQLGEALAQVKLAGDRLFEDITARLENDALSVSFPDAKLAFRFHGAVDGDLYKNCSIVIDDGHESAITDKGAGIQSATIISLFSYYTRQVNTQASALLCVEEPELYLHPHARRVVSDRLDDFLDGHRNQVIVTTHGVEFLRTSSETFNLLLVSKDRQHGTTARTLDAREFMKLLIDNNQNELFFADKVILCEGYDEYILRAVAGQLLQGELDRQNVSIVSVGGKDQFGALSKLIVSLGIACYVFADFDFLLRDPVKPVDIDCSSHKSIEQLSDEFFGQEYLVRAGLTRSLFAKGRNNLREKHRNGFYTAKHVSEISSERLPSFLTRLRTNGIGILDGEIEHLSINKTWIAPGVRKIDLPKLYQLRERTSAGESIETIFVCEPILEFLQAVLQT